jgi:predicted N-acetyltransferase YhbS
MRLDNIIIRLEEARDHRIVEKLTKAAFNTTDRVNRSEINCPLEHYMVYMLRKKDGIMDLNFVAEMNGKVVGHIIYSKAYIIQNNGYKVDVINFGPISVLPELQRKGIGSILMKHSIEIAKN